MLRFYKFYMVYKKNTGVPFQFLETSIISVIRRTIGPSAPKVLGLYMKIKRRFALKSPQEEHFFKIELTNK